jgi:DNA (cytosine-5)-methyltransferase 1
MTLRELFGETTPPALYFHARMPRKKSIWGADESAPTIRSASNRTMSNSYVPHPDDAALIENGHVYARPVRGGRGVRSIDEPFPTVTRTAWERPTPRYLNAPHPADPIAASETAVITIKQLSRIQGFPQNWCWQASAKRDLLQMIANAVPAPTARVIGEVVLARHLGLSVPAVEGRFLDWLVRRGKSRATARNVKANLGRARRLLKGRLLADYSLEIMVLEISPAFHALSKVTRSDLRQAVRLYAEFRNDKTQVVKRRAKASNIQLQMLQVAA